MDMDNNEFIMIKEKQRRELAAMNDKKLTPCAIAAAIRASRERRPAPVQQPALSAAGPATPGTAGQTRLQRILRECHRREALPQEREADVPYRQAQPDAVVAMERESRDAPDKIETRKRWYKGYIKPAHDIQLHCIDEAVRRAGLP